MPASFRGGNLVKVKSTYALCHEGVNLSDCSLKFNAHNVRKQIEKVPKCFLESPLLVGDRFSLRAPVNV